MSILIGFNDRDCKLGAKIFNMALARSSFGMDSDLQDEHSTMNSLCIKDLENSFEPYRKKHIANGFGDIELTQVIDRSSALIFAYRCNHITVFFTKTTQPYSKSYQKI